MAKSSKVIPKKMRKPRGEGKDPLVPVRMPEAMIKGLDKLRGEKTRSEVIRHLVDAELKRQR